MSASHRAIDRFYENMNILAAANLEHWHHWWLTVDLMTLGSVLVLKWRWGKRSQLEKQREKARIGLPIRTIEYRHCLEKGRIVKVARHLRKWFIKALLAYSA